MVWWDYEGNKRKEKRREKIQLPESRKPELAWKILILATASVFLILVVLGGELKRGTESSLVVEILFVISESRCSFLPCRKASLLSS